MEKIIKFESNVLLNYSLKGNGVLFESTFDSAPIPIIIGKSGLPQILEVSLYGLKKGDRETFGYDSLEIFGKYDRNNINSVSKDRFKNKKVCVGDIIEIEDNNKSSFITILEDKEDSFLVDLNHPLSNKEIEFNVEIIDVKDDIK